MVICQSPKSAVSVKYCSFNEKLGGEDLWSTIALLTSGTGIANAVSQP